MRTEFLARRFTLGLLAALAALPAGCMHTREKITPLFDAPRELDKTALSDYVIEPPDVLQIDLIAAVPKPPYRIQPLDSLYVRGTDVLPEAPLAGVYQVEPDGTLRLGAIYGSVAVNGMTLEEAKTVVERQLLKAVRKPLVDLSLAQGRAVQQVRGPHLVRPDGTVGLGVYGSVRIVGMTIAQARATIERHLGEFFQAPEVSVDVTGFNSKVYYVVFDGAGVGQQVVRLPVTGSETVLDAVGQVSGLTGVADTRNIWLARPSSNCPEGMTVLPVDWKAVTECGDARSNYQIMPGDRLFVKALPAATFANKLERVLFPIERIFGFTILGVGTVRTVGGDNNGGFGGGIGGF